MSSLIGNRYGEAFFEAGRDENCLDSLYDDVCLLRGVLGENEDFLKVMNAPSVAKEERSRLLDTIFDGNLQPLTLNYLHLLVDKTLEAHAVIKHSPVYEGIDVIPCDKALEAANMQVLTKRYGPAPQAYFIVPLVGSLFIDFCNGIIITGFMNILPMFG